MRRALLLVSCVLATMALAPVVTACPLCYGGDDPETARAAWRAAAVLAGSVYGVILVVGWRIWRRFRAHDGRSA